MGVRVCIWGLCTHGCVCMGCVCVGVCVCWLCMHESVCLCGVCVCSHAFTMKSIIAMPVSCLYHGYQHIIAMPVPRCSS